MISKTELRTALAAAETPTMVESAKELERAVKQWLDCEVIGIDTEFVRERTWRAELGLVQLSDGKRVWLVDPLKCDSLAPLGRLLGKQNIIKILHAPSEDLGVLLFATGTLPQPMFDTQTACAMLGQSLQMGYHKTVEWLLGITVDKGETRSNWCKRPLRPAQLHYAALDVCLLPHMHRQLVTRLKDSGRQAWLTEDCAQLVKKANIPADPEQSWKRIGGSAKLDGHSLAILKALSSWRDHQAEHRNLARGFVVKDNTLLQIAIHQPRNTETLIALDVMHPRALQRYGKALINIVTQALASGATAEPMAVLETKHRKLLSEMRSLVRKKADELGIEPALLASRRELEGLILSPQGEPIAERFNGWRMPVISRELLSLKADFNE